MTQNDVNKIINIIKANFVQKKDHQSSLITENQATVISSIIEKYIADEEIAPETHSPADALTQQQVDALVALLAQDSSLNAGNANTELLANPTFSIDSGSEFDLWARNTFLDGATLGTAESVVGQSENTIGIYASSAVDNSTDEHIYTNHIIQALTTNIPAGTYECGVRIDSGTLNVGYNNVVSSVEVKAIYTDDTTDSVVLIENTETATELAVAGDIIKDMSFAQEVKRVEFLVKVWNHANGSISGGAIVTQDSFVTISAVSVKVKD
jgi:hypothetical protein